MKNNAIKLPSIWDDQYNPTYTFLLNLNRKERRQKHRMIVVEALLAVAPQKPTKTELQRLSRIRRQLFLGLFREMAEVGVFIKSGKGTKTDPFRYQLAEKYRA